MNREETKKAIAVMQAYVDGEEIRLDTIRGLINPTWNWESYHYEVGNKAARVLDSVCSTYRNVRLS